ncbi:MAG: hypothetical protein QXG39_07135 [Candidatus Aenigmatarchaeota archaeon]
MFYVQGGRIQKIKEAVFNRGKIVCKYCNEEITFGSFLASIEQYLKPVLKDGVILWTRETYCGEWHSVLMTCCDTEVDRLTAENILRVCLFLKNNS